MTKINPTFSCFFGCTRKISQVLNCIELHRTPKDFITFFIVTMEYIHSLCPTNELRRGETRKELKKVGKEANWYGNHPRYTTNKNGYLRAVHSLKSSRHTRA
jgi:hypothetical protein